MEKRYKHEFGVLRVHSVLAPFSNWNHSTFDYLSTLIRSRTVDVYSSGIHIPTCHASSAKYSFERNRG